MRVLYAAFPPRTTLVPVIRSGKSYGATVNPTVEAWQRRQSERLSMRKSVLDWTAVSAKTWLALPATAVITAEVPWAMWQATQERPTLVGAVIEA